MPPRWLDLSSWNTPTAANLAAWRSLGFSAAVARLSIGGLLDTRYLAHRSNLRAAGYLTGAYAALHESADMAAQCRLFIRHLPADDDLPAWADVERDGLTAAMVAEWFDTWEAEADGRELWVYTGKPTWERIVPASQRARYAGYKLVIAAYPFDSLGMQPLDPMSVALRSTPPTDRPPALPAPWTAYQVWQHTGAGSLPGYSGFLDMSVGELPASESETPMQYLLTVRDTTTAGAITAALGGHIVALQAVIPIDLPPPGPPPPVSAPPLYSVRVKVAVLNVRRGPGTNNAIVNTLTQGVVAGVYEELGGWGRIAPEVQLWINVGAAYVERVPPVI